MDKYRILVYSSMYPNDLYPNLGIFIHYQVKSLVALRHDVVVISPVVFVPKLLRGIKKKWNAYASFPKHRLDGGIPVFHPRYFSLPGGKKWVYGWEGLSMYLGSKKLAAKLHRAKKFDIIHAHRIIPDGLCATLLGKALGIPVVCSARGGEAYELPFESSLCHLAFNYVLKNCNRITAVSKNLAQTISNNPLSQGVSVVYNGCDLDKFKYMDRAAARRKLNMALETKIFLFVGHIIKTKGIMELLEAFHTVHTHNPATRLIYIGYGYDMPELEEEIKRKNLCDSVLLTGFVSHENLPIWISASDIFVFPSYQEGLPNAVLEAMACRKPVIATKVGGIPEIIVDGETGILIESRNVSQLTQAMLNLLNNEELCSKLAWKAEALIHRSFTWESNAQRFTQLYQELLTRQC